MIFIWWIQLIGNYKNEYIDTEVNTNVTRDYLRNACYIASFVITSYLVG